MIEHFEKLTPLDHGGPEIKFTYFHCNCCKKNSQKCQVACHWYLNNHQSYILKILKKLKIDPFNRKKMEKINKKSVSMF